MMGLARPHPLHDRLLALFDADPARAERAYLDLRRQLVRFVEWRGCHTPEDLAQEALARGIKRIAEGAILQAGDPRRYFFGIAKHLLQEGWKPQKEQLLDSEDWSNQPSPSRDIDGVEARLTLAKVLGCLTDRERTLIVRYHTEDRAELSREFGIDLQNLRLRVHRIKRKLEAMREAWRETGVGQAARPP